RPTARSLPDVATVPTDSAYTAPSRESAPESWYELVQFPVETNSLPSCSTMLVARPHSRIAWSGAGLSSSDSISCRDRHPLSPTPTARHPAGECSRRTVSHRSAPRYRETSAYGSDPAYSDPLYICSALISVASCGAPRLRHRPV